jgi:NAD(P)-dependent dehydrogenase (short-subunit alcohol dehydrogenase family)
MAVEGFDLTGKRALVVGEDTAVRSFIVGALREAGADVREGGATTDAPRLVPEFVTHVGGLDVLVSCLGRPLAGPFADLSDGDLDRIAELNLAVPMRLIRAAGRHMLAHGGGRIVQVVSLLGERAVPNTAAYGAYQAGLVQMIRALSLEWARQNIRVNGIGLGWFEEDPMLAAAPEGLLRYLPMRRLGRPEEVGAIAVYLASDASDMMTGQVVWVDGAILSHA